MAEKKYTDTLEEMFYASRAEANPTQSQKSSASNIVITAPKSYDDVKNVIDGLKNGNSALVNLGNSQQAQRMLDFLSGAAYALNGSIEKVMEGQYLVTSQGVSIQVKK